MRKITTIILLFSISALFNLPVQAQNADIDLLVKLNSYPGQTVRNTSLALSNSTIAIAVGVPAGMGVASLITGDKDLQEKAIYIGASGAVTFLTTTLLKKTIRRERPYDAHPGLITPYAIEKSYSMPSGHTSIVFSTATSLTIAYPKWYIATPAFAWAGAVSYSRMNLGVHYPSDVLAGAVLGSASAWLTHRVNLYLRKPKRKEVITEIAHTDFTFY